MKGPPAVCVVTQEWGDVMPLQPGADHRPEPPLWAAYPTQHRPFPLTEHWFSPGGKRNRQSWVT